MATCYMKLGKPDSAAFYIDEGLSYDATNQHLLQLSAYYKERAGDYEGAITIYQQYNALYLDDVEYLSKQANALDMLGLYNEELDTWEYIIDIEPDNNDAINAIISVLGKWAVILKNSTKKHGKQYSRCIQSFEIHHCSL